MTIFNEDDDLSSTRAMRGITKNIGYLCKRDRGKTGSKDG